jgi:exopolysaccharide biosynthesis polyprenyl glycosylphosphotransferase
VQGHTGDAFARAGVETPPTVALETPAVPKRPAALPIWRPNVFRLAARHPGPGISPTAALRRVRTVVVVLTAVASVLAGAVAFELGSVAVAVAAVGWLVAEVVVVHLCRHLDELGGVGAVVRRHVLYAMTVCVVGVVLGGRAAALWAVGLVGVLGVVQSAGSLLLRGGRVRGLLGMAAPPSVLMVADRWTAEEAVADRAGLTSSAVVGVCLVEGDERVASVAGVPVLGTMDDVVSLVAALNIHEVAVRLETPLDSDWLRELEWSLEELGARLTLVTRLRNTVPGRVRVSRVGSSIVLGVSQARPTGLVRQVKAVAEALVALVGLVVALPVLVVCAVAVRLDSPGPVFFLQERVRDGGRTFKMVKIRTMAVGAEESRAELEPSNEVGGGLFKMRADPRVTRVGRVLRKLSLDELPQLVNIVLGQMSLVGPRPALPSEVATYDERARRRLGVKPGLTGLWQVSGRSSLSWEESISLDIDYVDNWSPGRDVRIAVSTVRAVAAKDGAY